MLALSFVPWASSYQHLKIVQSCVFEQDRELCQPSEAGHQRWERSLPAWDWEQKKAKFRHIFIRTPRIWIQGITISIKVSLENTWPFQSRLFCRRISMNADSLFKVRLQNSIIKRLMTWSSRCLQPSRSSWSFTISSSTPSTIVASPLRFALQN